MKLLGIETSCDNTGISIYDNYNGIIFNKTYNQPLHSKYGGIVPELASIKHIINIIKIIKIIIKKNIQSSINKIFYTAGPGLFNSLIIGSTIAKALSYSWNIESIPINHIEAHIFSPFINFNKINFPFISLIISGGNTKIIYVKNINDYEIMGETLDDSIGEIYDKISLNLNLDYPWASNLYKLSKYGIKNKYKFPRPMLNFNKYKFNFSFSGLKTYILNIIKNNKINYQDKCNLALEFENTLIDIILKKCELALINKKSKILTVVGGVISNKKIRYNLFSLCKKMNVKILFPKKKYSTDNGAMIAYLGFLKTLNNIKNNFNKLNIFVNNKWNINNI